MTSRGISACVPRRIGQAAIIFPLLLSSAMTLLLSQARADELPGLLIAAAKLMPATEEGRTRCSIVNPAPPLSDASATPTPPENSLKDDEDYTASTQGAFLGVTAPAMVAPPFQQALLEAGAAKRYRLQVSQRARVPNPLRGNGLPSFVPGVSTKVSDVVVVTGPDAALFPNLRNPFPLTRVPAVNGGSDDQGQPLGSAAVTPPGVWLGDRVCLTEVPNRVLEYGDIETRQNGLRFVTAAILFRAEGAPSWLADPRVVRSLYGRLLAQEVRIVGFRDDGDGWRPTLVSDPGFIEKKTHLVEGN